MADRTHVPRASRAQRPWLMYVLVVMAAIAVSVVTQWLLRGVMPGGWLNFLQITEVVGITLVGVSFIQSRMSAS